MNPSAILYFIYETYFNGFYKTCILPISVLFIYGDVILSIFRVVSIKFTPDTQAQPLLRLKLANLLTRDNSDINFKNCTLHNAIWMLLYRFKVSYVYSFQKTFKLYVYVYVYV